MRTAGSWLRRPRARSTPIGNERRIPTVASSIVSSSPPHRLLLTDGSGVAPKPPMQEERDRQRQRATPMSSSRRGTSPRMPPAKRDATRRPRSPPAARAGTGPIGDTSDERGEQQLARRERDRQGARRPARRPRPSARPGRRGRRASHSRQAWSAGYWPMRKSRRLVVIDAPAGLAEHPAARCRATSQRARRR